VRKNLIIGILLFLLVCLSLHDYYGIKILRATQEKEMEAMQASFFVGCMSLVKNPNLHDYIVPICKQNAESFIKEE
jgi:hypothetical protein